MMQNTQTRAASLVARSIQTVQLQYATEVFWRMEVGDELLPIGNDLGEPPVVVDTRNVVGISWQWDETSQKCKNTLGRNMADARGSNSSAQVAIQVMMQHGGIHRLNGHHGETATTSEPYFCHALFLERTTSDHLLEGVLRKHFVPFEDEAKLRHMASLGKLVVFMFSHDRASANYCVLRWLFGRVQSPNLYPNFLVHAEPCAMHGFQLVRVRPTKGKSVIATSFSFTRFLRCWRSADAWKRELIKLVGDKLVVVYEERNEVDRQRNAQIRAILYGDGGCYRSPDTDREESPAPLLKDVDRLLELLTLSGKDLIHNCHVVDGCSAHKEGLPIGSRCCKDREESIEKVVVATLNFLTNRAWAVASESRWTHTCTTLKRIAIGCLLGGLLNKSLANLQTFWGVGEDVEAQLAALLREAAGNFDAQRKARLIRISKVLAHVDAPWQVGVTITALQPVDMLMYVAFGSKAKKQPASFLDLLGWHSPRLGNVQSAFLKMLTDFSDESPHWALVSAAGCDFRGDAQRKFARQQILQLAGGLLDHFETRWGEPPYTLLPLIEADVPLAQKRRIATMFSTSRSIASHPF